jgi:hypothetical protein
MANNYNDKSDCDCFIDNNPASRFRGTIDSIIMPAITLGGDFLVSVAFDDNRKKLVNMKKRGPLKNRNCWVTFNN